MIRLIWGLVLIVVSRGAILSADAPNSNQINIVLAFADDLGRYASVYADPTDPSPNDVINTPVFDAIAAEGTLFENAFVSVPSCTPSRAALLTGRHFFRNGSHAQLHHPWYSQQMDPWDGVRGMGLALADAGYHIGWSYKMHLSEDRMGGKKRNYVRAGSRFNGFSSNVDSADDTAVAKAELLDEVRQNFRAFLDDRGDEQPFFYWFNPTNTHRPWRQGSGQRLWGLSPDRLRGKMPIFLPDNEVIREDFADYLGEAMAFDAAVGVLIDQLKQSGQWDKTLLVISGDHGAPGFPRGKCNLYDFGTRVPLVMRLPGRIAKGRRIQAPVSLIDLAPTFLALADVDAREAMDGQDLSVAMSPGESTPEMMVRGSVIMGRENHVDEARPGGLPYPMRAIRTRDFLYVINFAPDRWPVAQPPLAAPLQTMVQPPSGKVRGKRSTDQRRMDLDFGPTRDFFVRYEGDDSIAEMWSLGFARRPAEELYDIRRDPDQVKNLAGQPGYADTQAELRAELMATLRGGRDPRVMGDGDAFDLPPYTRGDPQRGRIMAP
ncbi:MAG: sulfatase [Planctomycetota bacterium]